MINFIRDFEKVNPKTEEPINIDDDKNIPNMTLQDMKDYFNGLKESITSEMRKEMLEYINKGKEEVIDNGNNKEELKEE